MNQIQMILLALFCSLVLAATGMAHGTGKSQIRKEIQDGINAAECWLKLVDEKEYKASWQGGSGFGFRQVHGRITKIDRETK